MVVIAACDIAHVEYIGTVFNDELRVVVFRIPGTEYFAVPVSFENSLAEGDDVAQREVAGVLRRFIEARGYKL
jgi:hypothetical protein